MLKSNRKRNILILLIIVSIVLLHPIAVLADSTDIVEEPDVRNIDEAGKPIAKLVNFLRYIGCTILVGFGYLHTFALGAAAKNANRRAQAIEALGWTALAAVIFFAAPYLLGIFKGISSF